MHFFRRYRTVFFFAVLVIACSVMVIQQIDTNRSQHVELREAFVLLHSKGYAPQADRLYRRLLNELQYISNKQLLDDFQRTLTLVDPASKQPENLIWNYHWTVSHEMEKRSEATLQRALKMATER